MTDDALWLTWATLPHDWCGRDVQAAHRTIAHAVDGRPHLWSRPDRHMLIVQTDHPVDPRRLWADSARSLPVRTRYEAGEHVEASLIANPVRSEPVPQGRGTRRPVRDREGQERWIRRHTEQALHLDRVEIEGLGAQIGHRHEHRVVHLRVAYTLWGAVTDPTALAELITRGIGPAKRYGCGLLVVASTDRSLR